MSELFGRKPDSHLLFIKLRGFTCVRQGYTKSKDKDGDPVWPVEVLESSQFNCFAADLYVHMFFAVINWGFPLLCLMPGTLLWYVADDVTLPV